MKRLLLMLLLGLAALALSACSGAPADETVAQVPAQALAEDAGARDIPVDVEIKEKMFIAQTNDIYINIDDYIGKTIKYEGMFFSSYYAPTESIFNMVIRYGPGCCGDDDQAGFEVWWDPDSGIQAPANNAWVEVIGRPEWYEENGQQFLRMNLLSLREMETRGAETVLQ